MNNEHDLNTVNNCRLQMGGKIYPCDKCEYAAYKVSHLKRHMNECVIFVINVSRLQLQQGISKFLIESNREVVRYPCNTYEYTCI